MSPFFDECLALVLADASSSQISTVGDNAMRALRAFVEDRLPFIGRPQLRRPEEHLRVTALLALLLDQRMAVVAIHLDWRIRFRVLPPLLASAINLPLDSGIKLHAVPLVLPSARLAMGYVAIRAMIQHSLAQRAKEPFRAEPLEIGLRLGLGDGGL